MSITRLKRMLASKTTSSLNSNVPSTGAPDTTITTDHKYGKQTGPIWMNCMKLRHQGIVFSVEYQKFKIYPTDYLSRREKPFAEILIEWQREAEDIKNILYMLHTTPIVGKLGLTYIASETNKDKIVKLLKEIIERGQRWIPRTCNRNLQKFEQTIPEIALNSNEIPLILPENLQQTATKLTHWGSHPGQSDSEHQLWHYFLFHNMQKKVSTFANNCFDCATFTNKKTTEPLLLHKVWKRNWETVTVDLFKSIPMSNHVIVAQGLSSRYPDCNWTWTHNHLVHKWTLIIWPNWPVGHLASLAKWLSVHLWTKWFWVWVQ